MEKKKDKPRYKQVKNQDELMSIAFYHLSARDLTVGELRDKISRNTEDTQIIEGTIASLLEFGYIKSDMKFIENFTDYKARNHYGMRGIVSDLRKRGLPVKLIEEVVPDLYESLVADESLLAIAYLKEHFQDFTGTNKDKIVRQMQQKRGFSTSHINTAISEHPKAHTLRTKLSIKADKLDLSDEVVKLFKKGKGRNVIRQTLRQKELSVDGLDVVLQELEHAEVIDFYGKAAQLLEQKNLDLSDYSEASKGRAFLARRGFTHDEINEAINLIKEKMLQ